MAFLDERYLLTSKEAEDVFKTIASLPIVDAHSHVEAKRIATDQGWNDVWEVEGQTDHYVWELMRRNGVPEEKITGSIPNREKWLALANIFPRLAGNPVYEWTHLDLRRRFGIEEVIGSDTGEAIWERTKELLSETRMRPRALLEEMNVEILCTTDSPLSKLHWHQELLQSFSKVRVLPTWRPDEAMRIDSTEWQGFVHRLEERTDSHFFTLSDFMEALSETHRYFVSHGCVSSDHGIERPGGILPSTEAAARIFNKARQGIALGEDEQVQFQTFMLHFFGELDAGVGWVMQLHIGAIRDYRSSILEAFGRDSGGDVASHSIELVKNLRGFLNKFDGRLRFVLYGLHPNHIYSLATLARAFPNVSIGAPWWFMDNPVHMHEHLLQVASVDLLSNHAGMVTDSRKLFSYESRTEMFRRTLANTIGEMVVQGRIPLPVGVEIAKNLAYERSRELFFTVS